jgi:hypothetical protein
MEPDSQTGTSAASKAQASKRRGRQRGDRNLPGPCSATGTNPPELSRPLQLAAQIGYHGFGRGGKSPGPSTGSEVSNRGVRASTPDVRPIPLAGAPTSLGLPPRLLPFLPVVSRNRVPRSAAARRARWHGRPESAETTERPRRLLVCSIPLPAFESDVALCRESRGGLSVW